MIKPQLLSHLAIVVSIVALCGGIGATPAQANSGKQKLGVAFVNFPKGTTCGVTKTTSRIKTKKRRNEQYFQLRQYAGTAEFFCTLPNGKTVFANYRKHLPGKFRIAAFTIAPTGEGHITWSDGDLHQKQLRNLLK